MDGQGTGGHCVSLRRCRLLLREARGRDDLSALLYLLMTMSTFNGWANHQTWNVALWIGNEESLNVLARRISSGGGNYQDLAEVLVHTFGKKETPDGVSFTDPALDHEELNDCLSDL
tara:strand:- start:966 stop:1316 length:351 start_codon:yes stop_codon:yes gene_type:complete